MNKRAKHTTIDYFCPSSHAQILSIGKYWKESSFQKNAISNLCPCLQNGQCPFIENVSAFRSLLMMVLE